MGFKKVKYEDHVTIITAENMNDIQDEIIRQAEDKADKADIPTDEHINELINSALGVVENGTY